MNPPAVPQEPKTYLVRANTLDEKPVTYVPKVRQLGNGQQGIQWHFSLHEAYMVKEMYIEKLRDMASRTSDPASLDNLHALMRGVEVVEYVGN